MMMSPEAFAEQFKGKWQSELIAKRNELLEEIYRFENHEISEDEYATEPNPGLIYEMNHLYLAEIAKLIAESCYLKDTPILGPELSAYDE